MLRNIDELSSDLATQGITLQPFTFCTGTLLPEVTRPIERPLRHVSSLAREFHGSNYIGRVFYEITFCVFTFDFTAPDTNLNMKRFGSRAAEAETVSPETASLLQDRTAWIVISYTQIINGVYVDPYNGQELHVRLLRRNPLNRSFLGSILSSPLLQYAAGQERYLQFFNRPTYEEVFQPARGRPDQPVYLARGEHTIALAAREFHLRHGFHVFEQQEPVEDNVMQTIVGATFEFYPAKEWAR